MTQGLTRIIVHCGCGNTHQFALDAYRLLFPDQSLPEVVAGTDSVKQFADLTPQVVPHLRALIKTPPFARLFEYNDTTLVHEWDLLKGEQLL